MSGTTPVEPTADDFQVMNAGSMGQVPSVAKIITIVGMEMAIQCAGKAIIAPLLRIEYLLRCRTREGDKNNETDSSVSQPCTTIGCADHILTTEGRKGLFRLTRPACYAVLVKPLLVLLRFTLPFEAISYPLVGTAVMYPIELITLHLALEKNVNPTAIMPYPAGQGFASMFASITRTHGYRGLYRGFTAALVNNIINFYVTRFLEMRAWRFMSESTSLFVVWLVLTSISQVTGLGFHILETARLRYVYGKHTKSQSTWDELKQTVRSGQTHSLARGYVCCVASSLIENIVTGVLRNILY